MRIVSIINTSGLIYDDRLIKEVETINNNNVAVEIVAFEKKNTAGRGEYNGIPFCTLQMYTRKWFPKPKKLLSLKAIEFTLRLFFKILGYRGRVLWFHNIEMMGIVSMAILLKKLGYFDGIIWDQHEYPIGEIRNTFPRRIYEWCCRNSDFVVFANDSRVRSMEQSFPSLKGKIHVINNYPNKDTTRMKKKELPDNLKKWLDGKSYILFQGIGRKSRMIVECAEAVKNIPNVKFVIVGPIEGGIEEDIRRTHGSEFERNVFIVGMVPQEELYTYLDNCLMSLVFYGNVNLNNWLCEPNRFYQAICRKKPVVCGSNPPMKDIVDTYKCGYVLEENDGSDYLKIVGGINYVLDNYEVISKNLENCYDKLTWQANDEVFFKIIKYFKKKRNEVY